MLAPRGFRGVDVSFGKPSQKATSGLTGSIRPRVQPPQEVVGNGDHHLGHRVSIYGIASRQNVHGRSVTGRGARVARRKCQLSEILATNLRQGPISTRSTSPRGICRKRVPTKWKASGSPVQRKS